MSNDMAPEQIIAQANAQNAKLAPGIQYGSIYDFTSPVKVSAALKGIQRPKNYGPGADPSVQMYQRPQATMERAGASYKISAGVFKPTDPTISGRNLSNLRVLGSSAGY